MTLWDDFEMLRAVTVDAHGVLLLPDPEAIRDVLAEFSCQPDDATCWKAHFEMVRLLDEMTQQDWPYMNRSFAQALGVHHSSRDDAGAILAETVYLGTSWIPAPGAALALARLIANGYGVAVVSNTVHGDLAQLLLETKLCSVDGESPNVAAIIDSQRIGVGKPDPRPFNLALDALGESPANCVHVGDSLQNDVVGAIGVGMRAVHIDPLNLCQDHAHKHSSSLGDFVNELNPEGSSSE
jgi:FMN phosphatase YigB (HAD superfamily)